MYQRRGVGVWLWTIAAAIGGWMIHDPKENRVLFPSLLAFVPKTSLPTRCCHHSNTCGGEESLIVRSMKDASYNDFDPTFSDFEEQTQDSFISDPLDSSRRSVLWKSVLVSSSLLLPVTANAAADVNDDTGLLESRVKGNALNPPPYGMEGADIFYPR